MSVTCGHCDGQHPTPYDVYLCSRNARTSQRRQRESSWGTMPYPFTTPEAMVKVIREGRYAVDVGKSSQRFIFLRITRPTKGRYKDALKIQTQHSDKLKEAAVGWPSGTWTLAGYKADIDAALRMIVVNPVDATLLYAKELGCCARCGIELTDERSRYYGIGPECEKHWPDLINSVNESKGEFIR
jgi:hypothetical protein